MSVIAEEIRKMMNNINESYKTILVEMSSREAMDIFAKHGVEVKSMTSSELSKARNKLAMKLHPDVTGGDAEELKLVNAAYDVLKNKSTRNTSDTSYKQSEPTNTPPWAWAGHSGGTPPRANISRENYTDINYFKKRMWELSGKSNKEYTIEAFDGAFFRNSITVYGSEDILKEMADAMIIWNSKGANRYDTRAVFVATKEDKRNKQIRLIYADDKYYTDSPIVFEHDSFNSNPSNDSRFLYQLPHKLDKLDKQNQID